MYGLIARATVRWASTWSEPFWASSSTTKMAICFQNRLLLSPSTTRPSARSLSPTHAVTVHLPGDVPEVWSLGSLRITSRGISPAFSNPASSSRNRSARLASG